MKLTLQVEDTEYTKPNSEVEKQDLQVKCINLKQPPGDRRPNP